MSVGIAMAVEHKQRAGDNPIQVRYEDGMPAVDKAYTYTVTEKVLTNPTYHTVTVACPMAEKMTALIDIKVATYQGKPVSQVVKDELQEFACEVLNDEPAITWGNIRYEETK